MTAPWTVVQSAAEAAIDPQVASNGFVPTVSGAIDYPNVASPAQFDGIKPSLFPAPEHGQHTEEVLLAIGRDWDEIDRLKANQVIN
jgi:crotonobetainyl-CoA:carnitine CoA-transferase CaiB-like acyl-CoA transferase